MTATRVWQSEASSAGLVAEAVLASTSEEDDDFAVGPGYIDILAEGEEAVGKIGGVITRSSEAMEEIGQAFQASTAEVKRLDQQGVGSFAARLKSARDLAVAIEPGVTEYEEAASEYLDLLHAQDAAVRYMLEKIRAEPETLKEARPYFQALIELAEVAVDQNVPVMTEYRQTNRGTAQISTVLQPITRRLDRAILRFLNGAETIDSWRSEIEALPGW